DRRSHLLLIMRRDPDNPRCRHLDRRTQAGVKRPLYFAARAEKYPPCRLHPPNPPPPTHTIPPRQHRQVRAISHDPRHRRTLERLIDLVRRTQNLLWPGVPGEPVRWGGGSIRFVAILHQPHARRTQLPRKLAHANPTRIQRSAVHNRIQPRKSSLIPSRLSCKIR